MGRRLGGIERKSAKKAAAVTRNLEKARLAVAARSLDKDALAALNAAKEDLRLAMAQATPRLVAMLTDPETPPGLFVELWKMIAPKVGLSDRVDQSVTLPDIPPLVVIVGDESKQ